MNCQRTDVYDLYFSIYIYNRTALNVVKDTESALHGKNTLKTALSLWLGNTKLRRTNALVRNGRFPLMVTTSRDDTQTNYTRYPNRKFPEPGQPRN
jgi:hypothetical protein